MGEKEMTKTCKQKNTPIRLSVIVPTYNCMNYLNECLHSVLDQLPEDCELIAVDDGSDEGAKEFLEECARKQKNLRVIICTHRGASSARNTGLDAAAGEFVTFIDCDDCMRDGFLRESLLLIDAVTDLYIFGIERFPLSGVRELWTVHDNIYPDASAFVDEYVRIRQLMVYSNCNKFYRRNVIEDHRLRFDESMDFGEDRMFNFRYLSICRGRIVTSSLIMLHYIQRSADSMSSKHIPRFFSLVRNLHKAKMDCFLSLSTGTTEEEKRDFVAYDISREVEKTLARFWHHPEERAENLPEINGLVFGGSDDDDAPLDILLVLGSSRCEYKIRRAWEIGRHHPGVLYIVSGGNPSAYGNMSEAEYMAGWLAEHGVKSTDIFLENRANFTKQNLKFSAEIMRKLRSETGKPLSRIGILTGGFHITRTRLLAAQIPAFEGEGLR